MEILESHRVCCTSAFLINSYNFVKDIKSKFWTVYDIWTFQKWSYPQISGLGKNVVAYHFWSAKMIWRGGPTKLAWRKELCILSLRIILLLKGLPNSQQFSRFCPKTRKNFPFFRHFWGFEVLDAIFLGPLVQKIPTSCL